MGGGLESTAIAAESPPVFWGKEPLVCPSGSGAQECRLPRGVAANPQNGHIFVSDSENNRTLEFNALGQFIKAWGWGVDTGAPEMQICSEASTCQAGLPGKGAGQFGFFGPQGIAVDSAGDVYVADRGIPSNGRVQKFDRKGNFVLMFGGEVNKTKVEEGVASEEEENVCPVDPGDECQGGSEGSGHGQFGFWPAAGSFIAINRNDTPSVADDKVYVGDVGRIQQFDTDGHYQGEIVLAGKTVQGLAVDEEGNLYYIDGGHPGVHKISPTGTPLPPETFQVKDAEGNSVAPTAVAVDSVGDVYAFGPTSCCGNLNNLNPIREFDPTGKAIAEFGKGEFDGSTGLATNLCSGSGAPGNLYVSNASVGEAFLRAYGTDPIGCFKARTLPATNVQEQTATLNGTVNPKGEAVTECFFEYGLTNVYGQSAGCVPSAAGIGSGSTPVAVKADIGGLTKGTVYHFRLIAKVGGETENGADVEFKTEGPPAISDEHVVSATGTEAVLRAQVNPEGFETTYHFEYMTQAAFEAAEGFEGAQATVATVAGSDRSNHLAIAELGGLVPGTAYRWRVLAENSSGKTASEAHRLFTYLPFIAETACPNQAFRGGPSAFLPDCRAYEMVSPVDKNGGDITQELAAVGQPGNYVQAAIDGDSLTYTALAAFADPPNAFIYNQYLAHRHERGQPGEGWSNEGIHIPVAGQEVNDDFDTFGVPRDFMAFTPDLCSAWLVDHQTPAPTADGQEGYPNLYRREDCGGLAGSFEALVPAPPSLPEGTPLNYVNHDSVQGYSADGSHTIFVANAKLAPESVGGGVQLYDRFGGMLHLVSVLPGGKVASGGNEVGSGPTHYLETAVSEDGSRVYWTGSSGDVFMRTHPEQGIVEGECSEAATACTLAVSKGAGFFWAAASNGSKALYSEGEDLFEFDLSKAEAKESAQTLIAHHVIGVAGASKDLSRVYFVSSQALTGENKPNSNGDVAIEDKPNLYLAEEGTFSFIGTLVPGDVGAKEPDSALAYSVTELESYLRATRVSTDGRRIVFDSRARLTGYDNTGPDGRASVEVFAYEAGGALDCISCNPSAARPGGVRELRVPYRPPWGAFNNKTDVPAAAWIPTWEHALHASNVISGDGNHIFFNSNDSLVLGDANGAPDVYEWEASGTGGCKTNAASYFTQNGGCLYLISSGESPQESEFWEASPDGRDVFFTTESSLLPRDPGSIDLYDARIDGGFPEPEAKVPCEGEACQSPPPPPQLPTPASRSYRGPGNPHAHKSHCPKGKRKVRKADKTRCVKKKKSQKSNRQRAGANGRAGR
jgi:DNA-binding beta-propeller fold protein YncE